jgi:tetratricopeptide (TPR) repeat protein
MGRDDWYRRTSWTAQDAADFQARLKRSRGDGSKAQYLRIQAYRLAEVGLHEPSLQLTDQLLREHPEPFELASTYEQRANSYAALGNYVEAIENFRISLAAQQQYPNVRTNVALSFAWFIILSRQAELYGEVEPLLQQYSADHGIMFPLDRFKRAVVRALLADELGHPTEARTFADEALAAAGEQHSGLRYHAQLGLVGEMPAEVAKRLAAIGGSV